LKNSFALDVFVILLYFWFLFSADVR